LARNCPTPARRPLPSPPFADQFAALRERFRASSVKTLDTFRALALQLSAAPTSPEVLDALRRELHRIHGTAGSFGYDDASHLASKLEERAVSWADDPGLDTSDRATMIAHFVGVLEIAFEVGAATGAAAGPPVPTSTEGMPSGPAAEAPPETPDVVVVEDDQTLSEMLQFGLRSAGYSYQAYATGPDALNALLRMRVSGHTSSRRPLILLDVDLPGLDGHSLHERLRVERPGAFAVVFQSAHASEAEQLRALTNGALDYVAKPLNLRIMLAKVPIWIRQAASGSEAAPTG
jgi:CheY-like chemotaxis protein